MSVRFLSTFFCVFLLIFGFNIYSDVNVEKNVNESNSQLIYNYIKSVILSENEVSSKTYKRYSDLQELIKENNLKKKKQRKPLKEEKNELKDIKRLIKYSENFKTLFNLFEKSDIYCKIPDCRSEWGVNEINKLGVLKNESSAQSLLKKLGLNFTDIGYLFNLFKLMDCTESVDDISAKINSISLLSIDDLEKYYDVLKKNERVFTSILSAKKAAKRYGLGDDTFNAYINFNSDNVIKTNHLNKRFLKLFLNPSFIFSFVIHLIPLAGLSGSGDIYKTLYFGIFMPSNYNRSAVSIMGLGFCLLNYYLIYGIGSNVYKYFNPGVFYKKLSKKFYCIKSYIKAIESIFNRFQINEDVYNIYSDNLKNCRNLFVDRDGFSKEQIEMLNLFEKLKLKWRYWRNWGSGRARKFCRFFYLFDKHKEMFVPAMFEIANLERYICANKLLNNERNIGHLCIPKFKYSSSPYVIMKQAWNPFISVDKVVKNDITLGKDTSESVSMAIIYGMNAGGKTTSLEMLGISYMFGRAFGLCFAKSADISYFKNIYITMDLTTNKDISCSKFMSEILSVDRLLQLVKDLHDNEYCLLLSDELFSGTNPETANELSVNVLKFLANNRNTLTLFSTHNISPTELARSNKFIKNYVMAVDTVDGGIKYKYKIERYNGDSGLLDVSRNIARSLVSKMSNDNYILNKNIILGAV